VTAIIEDSEKTKRYQKYLSTVKKWNDNLKERTNLIRT
jgi:hypothetical protein